MAITKVSRNLLNTGVSDSSDATAITIDSSENVLVGATSYNNDNAGVGLGSSGFLYATRDGSLAASFKRLTSTGSIADFRKDSSTIVNVTSDGICFGTDTAAANALDDYEEGTWSPTAAGVATAASYGARYTKIGQLVMAECYILIDTQNNTDQFRIGGLPYTSHNVTAYGGGSIGYVGSSNLDFLTAPLIPGNASYAYFHYIDGQNSGASVTNNKMYSIESGNQLFIMQCFYRTA